MRADDHLDAGGVVWRWIWHVALVLVDLSTILFDSLRLSFIFWLVVLGEQEDLLSAVDRHNGPAVSNIGHVADVSHDQYDDGTCTTSLDEVLLGSALLVSPLKEHLLGFTDAVFYGLLRILGEVLISDDELMELVSQEVGAS